VDGKRDEGEEEQKGNSSSQFHSQDDLSPLLSPSNHSTRMTIGGEREEGRREGGWGGGYDLFLSLSSSPSHLASMGKALRSRGMKAVAKRGSSRARMASRAAMVGGHFRAAAEESGG
jgi:hypothetical protein